MKERVNAVRRVPGTSGVVKKSERSIGGVVGAGGVALKTCGRLDIAFNNAGIEGDVKPTLIDHTEANFDLVMGINVKGVWLSMKYEIPQMLKTGGGAIVNCSSVAGVIGFPGIGIYSASKHAVVGLTKAAALEYSAQGIRVNAVNPAVIDTEMVDRLADGMNMKKDHVPSDRTTRSGRRSGGSRFVAVFGQGVFCDGAQYDGRWRIHRPLT